MSPLPTSSSAVVLRTSRSELAGGAPPGTAALTTLAGLAAVLTSNAPVLGAGLLPTVDVASGPSAPTRSSATLTPSLT
jgi:hypothetical protein